MVHRARMARSSNNNPMLMSGGSRFPRLTLRSPLFPMPSVTSYPACSMAGGRVFRTCPRNFMANWFAMSRLQMIRRLLSFLFFFFLSFLPPPFLVDDEKFQGTVSPRGDSLVTKRPGNISFRRGSADWWWRRGVFSIHTDRW